MKRWKRLTLGLFGLWLLFTWLPLHNPHDAAAVIQRGEDGEWVRQENTPLELGWELAGDDATVHSSGSGFQELESTSQEPMHISRIWIVNRSEGRLATRFGRGLQESLLADPALDEVAYFPAGDLPLEIRRPPHLFVTYRVHDSTEHHLPWQHILHAELEVHISRFPLCTQGADFGDRQGPHWIQHVEFETSRFGWVTRSLRYRNAIGNFRDTLNMPELLASWRAKDMPDTPLAWAGPIPAEPTDIPWPTGCEPQLLVAQAPAPLQREHTWAVPAIAELVDPVSHMRSILIKDGMREISSWNDKGGCLNSVLQDGQRMVFLHFTDPEVRGEWVLRQLQTPTTAELAQWVQSKLPETKNRRALIDLLAGLADPTRQDLGQAMQGEDLPEEVRQALR